jgi:hypothetical protein
LTDEIVDKHLDDLKRECLSYETRDVAKFMEKLKTQSESIDGESQDEKKGEVITIEKKTGRRESESKKELDLISRQKELKAETTVSDKKKDANHIQVKSQQQRKPSLSPTASMRKPKTIDMDSLSPTPQADSQVQIVKIRSPGGSRKASRENSRNNSIERSPSKEKQQQQTLKKPEGGILKKPSPKFGKASESRLSNSLRPDSFISPFSSFESKSDKLSPSSEIMPSNFVRESQNRASFSDYEKNSKNHHQNALKSRSLESSLEHLKSALKHQSSYERVSPIQYSYEQLNPKYYSLSAQQSIESNRSPVRYCSPVPPGPYYNEPYYEYPKHKRNRETRSLERPDFSRQSSSECERLDRNYEAEPRSRRHSVYEHRSIPYHYYSLSPEDYLMSSHYEQPSACVDCYYQSYRQPYIHYSQQPPPLPQRNPSQQQSSSQQSSKSSSQSRQRQSRSRKKLSRRMSSNYFNKSFDDDDMHNASAGKQSLLHDNEEIRV